MDADIIKYVLAEASKSNVEKRKVGCVITDTLGTITGQGFNNSSTHAEINAIASVNGEAHKAWVTHPPCPECSKALIDAGVVDVEVVKEFIKFDGDKLRLDLIPPSAIRALGEVLTFGARKYKPNNWRECDDTSRYLAALLRHLLAYQEGECLDKDSGLPHLWHVLTNVAFLVELEPNNLVTA